MHSASELEWLRGREYLRENRHELGVSAADGYPSAARVAGTPLLAAPGWIPAAPVPLGDISIALSRADFSPRHNTVAHAAPENSGGTRYASYSEAMRALDAPAVFENRPLYRLTGADLAGERPRLEFGRGRYFEAIDVGTAAAHEYAAARLGLGAPDGRTTAADGGLTTPDGAGVLREAIGDPCDLAARPVMMAVATLTVRLDRSTGAATFPLHWRDPAKVGHAGGMYQVLPAGIFQPSGEAPWNWPNDFDLWRCMLREYAEELLGADEDHDSERNPIDYAAWPFAARMTALRAAGRIQAWCLGLGVDPLTFATDLLTVAVFDAAGYDELFGDLVRSNAEGTVIASWPFEEQAVTALIRDHPVQAAGAALLSLALRHKDLL
ncbi:MAG: transcriptional regulator [Actinomycetia bacterium]|nr:transcriptional regulator [Actinomycetes bacterium]